MKNTFTVSDQEKLRILNLHESYREWSGSLITEQTEKIYDKYDSGYDYKVSNGKWVASKKGQNKWFSLEKYPTTIQKLDTKYSDARTSKSSSTTKPNRLPLPFKNKEEGDMFRNWVNDNYPDYAKTLFGDGLGRTGSYNNSYMRAAWNHEGEDGLKSEIYTKKVLSKGGDKSFSLGDWSMPNIGDTLKDWYNGIITGVKSWSFEPTKGNFVIPFVFPEYEPKLDGKGGFDEWIAPITRLWYGSDDEDGDNGTYGKLGHAGIATVLPNGSVSMFEYGRYSGAEKGMGITKSKSLGKIAKMDKDGLITNFNKSVAEKIKKNSEGDGPRLSMDAKLVPTLDSSAGISQAKQTTSKPYEGFDMDATDNDANCGTYTVEVARAAGVPLGEKCYPNTNRNSQLIR